MAEKIVIRLVVIIAFVAHWLIKKIKFKVDEGAIINLLKQAKIQEFNSIQHIYANLKLA
jgi:hypothetical protein